MSAGGPVPSPYYRVSVKALVSDGHGRLLVVQNEHAAWEVPGGGWEHGETLEQCLDRELHEELGVGLLRVTAQTVCPVVSFGAQGQAWLKLMIPAELDSEEFRFGDGMQAARYVNPAEFGALIMHPSDRCLQPDADRFWPVARP